MSSSSLFLRFLARPVLWLALLACLGATLVTSGCQRQIYTAGQFPDPEQVAKLEYGTSDRPAVASLLGSPSHISNFSDSRWYYISQKQDETIKFRSKKIQQVVLVLAFDEQGLLSGADAYQLQDGVRVRPSKDRTETFGRESGLLQEILAGIARIGRRTSSSSSN